MAQIDNFRNKLNSERKKLADLKKDLANEQKISAQQQKKISDARSAISRTTSQSTISSKNNDINRASKALALSQDKIAKKNEDVEKKRLKESKRHTDEMEKNLERQQKLQEQIQKDFKQLKKVPNKITVLFLASNPIDTVQLRLDEEVHAIQEKIRLSDYRDSIDFESRWAVRSSDILQAINETNPTIIHFSGHGTQEGNLVLQNQDGSTKLITVEAMSATISTLSDTIRLVVFNACFSKMQAASVINYIESAIGMSDSIGDEAAQIFAAQLYSSIEFGRSLENSFRQAKAALMLENIPEENTPQLFIREDTDGNDIILV